ncbi:MAG: hypothetical protein Q4E28_05075 [Clostridia bacterium]|nr:hypothetical protein [Clostridia bacterium]
MTQIKSHSLHFIDRVIGHIFDVPTEKARSGVLVRDIKATLLKWDYEQRKTESLKITGKNNKVSISRTKIGNLVQVNPYKKEKR